MKQCFVYAVFLWYCSHVDETSFCLKENMEFPQGNENAFLSMVKLIIKIEPRYLHGTFIQQFPLFSENCPITLYFRVSFYYTYYNVLKSTEFSWIELWWLSQSEERVLCSLCLLLVVRAAETQYQVYSSVGSTFPPRAITPSTHCHKWGQSRGDSEGPGNPEERSLLPLKIVFCIWDFCVELTQDLGYTCSIAGHVGCCMCGEVKPLPQTWQDNKAVKGDIINILSMWDICWNLFLLKSTLLVPEGSPDHSMPCGHSQWEMGDC